MTGMSLATLVAIVALAGTFRSLRRRRPASKARIGTSRAGGRAFADHLGSLSFDDHALKIPTVPGSWRRMGLSSAVR